MSGIALVCFRTTGSSYVAGDLADWMSGHDAKSNVGIRRSRTASYLSTAIYPATSKLRLITSLATTITAGITRASAILHRPMSTSDEVRPSY